METAKNVWIAAATTPKALWAIAIGVLAFLFAKIYVFDLMPAAFPGAREVGRLFQNLGEATLAALIFFIFSYQLPFVVEQQRVGRVVIQLIGNVVELVIQPLQRVYVHVEGEERPLNLSSVTEALVATVFERVEAATVKDWLLSLTESDQKCRQNIDQLWRYSRFIDSDVFRLLSQLELSEYSEVLPMFSRVLPHGRLPTLVPLATPYFWNFEVAIELSRASKALQVRYAIPTT
jgi:hypothetical protein